MEDIIPIDRNIKRKDPPAKVQEELKPVKKSKFADALDIETKLDNSTSIRKSTRPTAGFQPSRRRKLECVKTLEDAVSAIRRAKRILVLTGAGISVSSGIPDFRNDPEPFYQFAKELYPGKFQPSPTHHFIRLLERKGKLLRNYTQNIDTLENIAGVKNVVYAHGSFATASCLRCKAKLSSDDIRSDIMSDPVKIPFCLKKKRKDMYGLFFFQF
eukprot:GSMAST32.ASY1.ANO1.42.1 assembled CDS